MSIRSYVRLFVRNFRFYWHGTFLCLYHTWLYHIFFVFSYINWLLFFFHFAIFNSVKSIKLSQKFGLVDVCVYAVFFCHRHEWQRIKTVYHYETESIMCWAQHMIVSTIKLEFEKMYCNYMFSMWISSIFMFEEAHQKFSTIMSANGRAKFTERHKYSFTRGKFTYSTFSKVKLCWLSSKIENGFELGEKKPRVVIMMLSHWLGRQS